ncbi:MAG: SDR family NAD(P)-dependent oxidoreductase [Chitinophagia bacterium]|nr:SDR family NAD(P)-dependent oxidoreductase [Chitinophagia bacterium]
MNRTVLVTGATSGFGKAIAERFAASGDRVIVTGRRSDRLEELVKNLSSHHGIEAYALPFDVRDRSAVNEAVATLPEAWRSVDILVNNAGLALGRDYFEDASIDDWDTMLDTNVKGVMYVTRAVLPLLRKPGGHIVNIGSIAGKEVYEKGNGYCASKHALDALSKSMRADLLRHGIRVTGVHPGAAETEFSLVRFKGDASQAAAVYAGYQALSADDVADVVQYCTGTPPHVCINDIVVTCTAQANSFYLHR